MNRQGYRPPQNPLPQRPSRPTRPPRPQKQRGHSRFRLSPLLVLVVLLVAALGVGATVLAGKINTAHSYVQAYNNVFLDTVYVDGICLGGKSFEEGKALVEQQIADKKNSWYITMSNNHGETATLTADQLGLGWDATQALNDAWAVGRDVINGSSSELDKQQRIQELNSQQYHYSSAEQSLDTSAIDNMLTTLSQAAYRAPTDAQYLGFDPSNPSSPFSFQSESYGQMLDTSNIREQILKLAENFECGEVVLTTVPIAPNVTVADLQQNYTLRYRAYTPISSHSTDERNSNIRNAFYKINGTVIESGESFSFNKIVGKREISNGFQLAVEYVYGNEEVGVGGGVCQCSTTVYLAAVQSGMTITKRRAHSMAVSYADLGKDATVSDTKGHEIDFSFRNDSDGPVYITARVVGSNKKNLQCEVSLWGKSLGEVSYELYAQTVETILKPEVPTYVKDEEANYVTYTDEEKVVSKGRDGYVVESYLITYNNNVEVSRKLLYTDTYPAKADTVYVGVTER